MRVTLQKRAAGSKAWTPVSSWSGTAEGKATARVSEEKKVAAEDVLYLTSTTLRNNVFFIKRADDIMPHTAPDTEGM